MSVSIEADSSLPVGWMQITVGELFEFAYGKGLVKNARKETGPYPVYGSSGVVGFHDQYLVAGPKIIVGRKGAAGAVHLCLDNCWPIDTTYFVNSNGCVDIKFSCYLLKNIRLNQFETSTAIPGLNRDDAYRLKICLPPVNEQHRIVDKIEALFSELDKGIEALKTAREQLKVYRQAILKHAFEGKLTARWREENPDKLESPEQLLAHIQQEREAYYQKRLKEWKMVLQAWDNSGQNGRKPAKPKPPAPIDQLAGEELHDIPAGWIWLHLEYLVSGVDQGWSPKCENRPAETDEWGVIKTTAIQHGEFLDKENKSLSRGLQPRAKHQLNAGDILVTRAGPRVRVGVCCLVRAVRDRLMNCDKVYRVRSIEAVCRPDYLEAVLNSPRILDKIEKIKSGISDSGVNLNQGAFLRLYIPCCSLSEQKQIMLQIERNLSVIAKQEETIEAALRQAETLRQSILKKAFSGQLVQQDPNDEPAAVLLESIRAGKTSLHKQAKPKKLRKRKATA